ncbi:uncharacterized protein AMSG_07798 [Thecamonas trahens ATCC 50062]|uniref:DUF4200 domain-containing protein n=1 Tax=Thecamonas trahens ATCC 50062 TaxID=461836 RepID=A0A0L0DH93_THETB|nr:hypothetical protein AMSG_07798 [Thecamonas trahens ATCC 50062]KNC51729.1 hypothetical protein AMSG_07798 [Thecamonas trahens ATCC 50062]|eukprot:XP_013755858.1 hypothetical protein AMSG_07798 [Thecamonas trahens ATCC 50062]
MTGSRRRRENVRALANAHVEKALASGQPHPGSPAARRAAGRTALTSDSAGLRRRRGGHSGSGKGASKGRGGHKGASGLLRVPPAGPEQHGPEMPEESAEGLQGREAAIFRLTAAEVKRQEEEETTQSRMRTLLPDSSLALQSTLIEEAQAENDRVDYELDIKKNWFHMQMKLFDAELAALNESKLKLLKEIDAHQSFIENKKRKTEQDLELARKRMTEREEIEATIVTLQATLAALKEREADQTKALEALKGYDEYLKSFLRQEGAQYLLASSSDAYSDGTQAILKRYETLVQTQATLLAEVERAEAEIEKKAAALAAEREHKDSTVLVLTTQLLSLHFELEKLQSSGTSLESAQQTVDEASKARYRTLGEITMAIDNLYTLVMERQHRKKRIIPLGVNRTQAEANAAASARIKQHVEASGKAHGHYLHKLDVIEKIIIFYTETFFPHRLPDGSPDFSRPTARVAPSAAHAPLMAAGFSNLPGMDAYAAALLGGGDDVHGSEPGGGGGGGGGGGAGGSSAAGGSSGGGGGGGVSVYGSLL